MLVNIFVVVAVQTSLSSLLTSNKFPCRQTQPSFLAFYTWLSILNFSFFHLFLWPTPWQVATVDTFCAVFLICM